MAQQQTTAQGATLIAALSIFDDIGGVQKFNQRVLAAVTSSGRNVVVISLRDRVARNLGPQVTYQPCHGRRIAFILAFITALMRCKPTITLLAHINLISLGILLRILRPSCATALFVHGIEVWNEVKFRPRQWFEPMLIRRCIDIVISVSAFTERVMRREFNLDQATFRRLNNAIDIDDTAAGSKINSATQRPAHTIISVSRLDEAYKGIAQVICALPRLRTSLPDLRYDIIGRGKLEPSLQALAKALRVDDIVLFRGEVSEADLTAAYEAARVFVLPSAKEGFGIVFLEAWKQGLPVICGNADASAEVVIDGESGIVIDPADSDALTCSILLLLQDNALAARMATQGMHRVRKHFSGAAFEQNLHRIMDDMSAIRMTAGT